MKLYFLRHGLAAQHDPARFPEDSLRPLTEAGQEQVRSIARTMRRLDVRIDLLWYSPLLRAKQTADLVAETLSLKRRAHATDHLAPDGDRAALLEEIDALDPRPEKLMLVGHDPYLSKLLSFLAGEGDLNLKLKKAGLARLDISGPIVFERRATLEWLVPPRLLAMPD